MAFQAVAYPRGVKTEVSPIERINTRPTSATPIPVAIGRGRTEIEVDVIRQSQKSVSAEALRLARLLVSRARA